MEKNIYFDTLKQLFLKSAQRQKNNQATHEGKNIYYRWISTSEIAKNISVPNRIVLKEMRKLEKQGVVKMLHQANWIQWGLVEIEGYEEMIYKDYLKQSI